MATLFLFEDNGEIKTYDEQSGWVSLGMPPATEEMFLTYGIADLSIVTNNNALEALSNTFNLLVYQDTVNSNNAILTMTAVPNGRLVLSNGDISLSTVETINSVTLTSIILGNGILKVIVSTDKGATWKTYNRTSWEVVDITNLLDVKTKGMPPDVLNGLNSIHWSELITGSKTIRFGYYLEIDNTSDRAENDVLIWNVNMKGKWRKAILGTDYDSEYPSNDMLNIIFHVDGSYKINYYVPSEE